MDYYIVKVKYDDNVLQPIVAVGDKVELMKKVNDLYDGADIEFSPKKFPFEPLFIDILEEGLYNFYDLVWEKN